MAKLCSCCSMPAQYSLALLLSTVGTSRRIQKCSPVVLFCNDCVHALRENELWGTNALCHAFNRAYTAIKQGFNERSGAPVTTR
jgi:hypothetical protein